MRPQITAVNCRSTPHSLDARGNIYFSSVRLARVSASQTAMRNDSVGGTTKRTLVNRPQHHKQTAASSLASVVRLVSRRKS